MTINQHIPIMSNEILSFINSKKNLSILDCTFGGGGHSKKFLECGTYKYMLSQANLDEISILKIMKKFLE